MSAQVDGVVIWYLDTMDGNNRPFAFPKEPRRLCPTRNRVLLELNLFKTVIFYIPTLITGTITDSKDYKQSDYYILLIQREKDCLICLICERERTPINMAVYYHVKSISLEYEYSENM